MTNMLLRGSSRAELSLAPEIETARALFAVGDYDDALRALSPIIEDLNASSANAFAAMLLKACVESQRDQYAACLDTLELASRWLDEMPAALRGRFHGQRALAHRNLDQVDNAVIEYEAARFWATEAGDEQTLASVRNNLAKVYSDAGRFEDAIVEVEAAIKAATRLRDDVLLGRYYDLKAQILIDHKHFAAALTCSKKAVALLSTHPSAEEARATHGLAMVCLGATYLKKPVTSLETFRARHDAAKIVHVALDKPIVERALRRSKGHVLKAAALLSVSHSILIPLIDKYQLARIPKRRRAKRLTPK